MGCRTEVRQPFLSGDDHVGMKANGHLCSMRRPMTAGAGIGQSHTKKSRISTEGKKAVSQST